MRFSALPFTAILITYSGLGLLYAGEQSPDIELEPLVVTAYRQEKAPLEIPASIQAVSGNFIGDFGLSSFSKTISFIPGAVLQEQSSLFPGFSIRGITSDAGDAYFEPRVSVFQDGIPISDTRGASVELFDIERIEILKGPQGAYFGRAASSGAIQILQNKPLMTNSGYLNGGVGNLDRKEGGAMLNTVLVKDQLANRFAFQTVERDGYVKNLEGGDLQSKDTWAIRDTLRWDFAPDWRLDLVGNYQKDAPTAVAFRQTRFPTTEGSTDIFSSAQLNRGEALRNERKIASLALTLEGQLSDDLSLVMITSWRRFDTRRELDADGTQALAFEVTDRAKHRQFSEEVRLNYKGSSAIEGHIGISGYQSNREVKDQFLSNEQAFWTLTRPLLRNNLIAQVQQVLLDSGVPEAVAIAQAQGLGQLALPIEEDIPLIDTQGQLQLATQMPLSLGNLAAAPPPLSSFAALAGIPLPDTPRSEQYVNTSDRESYELFADATWNINEQIKLNLGGRLTYEDLSTTYRSDLGSASSVVGLIPITTDRPAYPNAFFPVDPETEANEDLVSTVGQMALSYHWPEKGHAYLSVSHGRRPPVLRIDESGFQRLDEERIWNYEIGYKGRYWNHRFQIDSALFYFDYEHFQTLVIENGRRRSVDAGNASAYGFETSLRTQATEHLLAFLNYGYTHFRFDDESTNGNDQLFAGNQPRLSPDHKLALGLSWRQKTGIGTLTISPSWVWQSKVYFENSNDPDLAQSAYSLLALTARLDRGAWSFQFWMENALDEEYLLDAGNIGNDLGIPTYVPAAPRMFGLNVSYQY